MHKYAMSRGEAGGAACTRYVGVVRGGKTKVSLGLGQYLSPHNDSGHAFVSPSKEKQKKRKKYNYK